MADQVTVTLFVDAAISELMEAAGPALVNRKKQVLEDGLHYVPVLRTPLRESRYTQGPQIEGDLVVVRNGFDVPYALLQHETREFRHRSPAQWKFLERAEKESSKSLVADVGEDIKRRLR